MTDNPDNDELLRLPVVPALPGCTVLRYYLCGGDDDMLVHRMPVVAWRIDRDGALPVTPDYDYDREASGNLVGTGLLMPDGRVFDREGETTFVDETQWRAEMANTARLNAEEKPPEAAE
jgi:hypothetical protein